MDSIRITIVQTDIVWEDKQDNLRSLHEKLQALRGTTEIVVLPEMFSTGFTMHSDKLAENIEGETITLLKAWSTSYQLTLVGSFIAKEHEHYYNRGFFLTPEGDEQFYDKKHLFRMGDEPNHFEAGQQHLIVDYQGWHISLFICYDLRFPVWNRNVNNAYDLAIYVANWPDSRRMVWDTLLKARALENQCYVCGVNRIGVDGYGLTYNGGSVVYSPKGEVMISATDHKASMLTTELSLSALRHFREKFPVWKDADSFQFQGE